MPNYTKREGRGDFRFSEYDGGLHPEDVFKLIEAGAELVPTDKNYKIYINSGKDRFKAYMQDWNEEQKLHLIELINENKIKFAYPGYFYVLPFFCVKESVNAPE